MKPVTLDGVLNIVFSYALSHKDSSNIFSKIAENGDMFNKPEGIITTGDTIFQWRLLPVNEDTIAFVSALMMKKQNEKEVEALILKIKHVTNVNMVPFGETDMFKVNLFDLKRNKKTDYTIFN